MQSLPPSCTVLPMDNDAVATLIPLSVIMVGMDWVNGFFVLHTYLLPLLNGH